MRYRLPEPRLFLGTLVLLSGILALLEDTTFAQQAADDLLAAAWSPDSSSIACVLPGEGDKDTLCIASSDGSSAERIFNAEGMQAVAWAPNGARIAVASTGTRTKATVHIIDASNKSHESVALGRTAENLSIGWSSDSTRIVVQSDRSILLVSVEDKSIKHMDDVKPPVSRMFFGATSPLSPDNKLLLAAGPVDVHKWAFGYRPGRRTGIETPLYAWLVKTEGKQHTLPVVHDGSLAGPPLWSPHGKAIAFMTRTQPNAATVWMNVVNEVGTPQIEPVRVTYPLSTTPVWSPPGTDAAYFWRDSTGKCMVGIVSSILTSVVPLQQELERVLFASWNEPAKILLIAVTREREIICARLDLVSGEFVRLSEFPPQFKLFLPSPDLTRLLLVAERAESPRLQLFDIDTGEIVELKL